MSAANRWHQLSEVDHCTACGTHVSLTPDWTLWPWPDNANLCASCNDERHDVDDYLAVENKRAAQPRAGTRRTGRRRSS